MWLNRFHNAGVAFSAGVFGDLAVMWFDLDWFMKPTGGKPKRMPESI